MRRIEALTGAGADAYLRSRVDALAAATEAAGAQTAEVLPDRIRALQDELREAKRRLKAGAAAGGLPKSSELVERAEEVAPGVRLVAFAGPSESVEAMKGAAKDLRGVLGSGVIALGLDADEPQLFVTISDDLVARGLAAGDLVREATAAIDGRGGGRPEMAQGKGTRREGLPAAIATIGDLVRARLDAPR
jgi:alanyl-tRNA synthetase